MRRLQRVSLSSSCGAARDSKGVDALILLQSCTRMYFSPRSTSLRSLLTTRMVSSVQFGFLRLLIIRARSLDSNRPRRPHRLTNLQKSVVDLQESVDDFNKSFNTHKDTTTSNIEGLETRFGVVERFVEKQQRDIENEKRRVSLE